MSVSSPTVENAGARSGTTLSTFWSGPLGYPQAAAVTAMALIVGAALHFLVGYHVTVDAGLAWPLAIGFVTIAGLCGRIWRERRVMRWVAGVPFSVCSLAGVSSLALVGAVMPSSMLAERFGVESVFGSWPFQMALAILTANLVFCTVRRCWPLTAPNGWFTLCHGGLLVSILGGWVGAAGLEQATLTLYEGRPERVAERADGTPLPLPFEVTLRDFRLDQFAPVFGIGVIDKKAPEGVRFKPGNRLAAEGMCEWLGEYEISVKRYLPRAALVGDTWHAATLDTCAPAAHIVAQNRRGRTIAEGWVSSGSLDTPRLALALSDTTAVMMAASRPREFRSTIDVEQKGSVRRHDVQMNRTANIGAYRLYQTSYDEAMGPASKFSVLTVVEDRSIGVVYTGLFMILASVLWMLWNGFQAPVRTSEGDAQ